LERVKTPPPLKRVTWAAEVLLKPDPNFRANPERAVYVQGAIDESMVARLTPSIIKLQNANRGPITVYIDSRGGSVFSAELILRLLSASNQNGDPPCRIITVVTNRAASAAADLLSSGDYAIALPESTILYHGVRTSLIDPLTVELGSAVTESLKISNDRYAMALARRAEGRFMFRFVMTKHAFSNFRQKAGKPNLSDLDCFLGIISQALTHPAQKILERARERHIRYSSLLDQALAAAKKRSVAASKSAAQVEAVILKQIIDFEVTVHRKDPNWNFRSGGLSRLNDDFFLLREYLDISQSDHFNKVCDRWGNFALTADEKAELEKIPDDAARSKARLDKVKLQFQPLWSFFVALCHVLQEGENELSAIDAFGLGLIDEVMGTQLDSLRMISEFQLDTSE
jgi:ATP-dependent protease ClpP protease subunit